jgi:hypothetical protein
VKKEKLIKSVQRAYPKIYTMWCKDSQYSKLMQEHDVRYPCIAKSGVYIGHFDIVTNDC